MYIYKITNNINNKIYIGKSTDSRANKIRNYYGSGLLINRAIEKYGIENFTKEILEKCDNNTELCVKEKYWIEVYNSRNLEIGYNIAEGGDGGDTISNHPNADKIKSKISKSLKNRIFTEEHKINLRKNHNSKDPKVGIKISNALKGRKKSQDHKKKLAEASSRYNKKIGRWVGDDNPMKKYNYKWAHNPSTGKKKRIVENSELPKGFIWGYGDRKKIYTNCKFCNRRMVNTSIVRHERVCSEK